MASAAYWLKVTANTRRWSWLLFIAATLLISPATAIEGTRDDLWDAGLHAAHFGDREVIVDDSVVQVRAPRKTDDSTHVPVSVLIESPGVRRVHVFLDTNPQPLVAIFKPETAMSVIDIGLRVRLDRSTMFRAIAELEDGRLVMGAKHIKAVGGGCSAAPTTDVNKALAEMGRMKLRTMHRDSASELSFTELMIRHPNLTGMQRDLVSGGFYPAQFLRSVTMTFNGQPLLSAELGFSVSTDPVIRFAMPAGDGTLTVSAEDSKGKAFVDSFSVKDGQPNGRIGAASNDPVDGASP